jgi:hypothetical protein
VTARRTWAKMDRTNWSDNAPSNRENIGFLQTEKHGCIRRNGELINGSH